jgi:hypothetical protein
VLSSLGYRGGLKRCERQLGLARQGVEDIDGLFAVLLWNDYVENPNPRALETLLAYNTVDVVNLETLLYLAFNLKLKETPFARIHKLTVPPPPKIHSHRTIRPWTEFGVGMVNGFKRRLQSGLRLPVSVHFQGCSEAGIESRLPCSRNVEDRQKPLLDITCPICQRRIMMSGSKK